VITKICTTCLEPKASPDDFYKRSDGTATSQCKECLKAAGRARRDAQRIAAGTLPIDRTALLRDAAGRTCSRCLQYKAPEHFHKQPRSPDGLQGKCKDCQTVEARNRYRTKNGATPYLLQQPDGTKQCRGCGSFLPLDAFGNRTDGHGGLQARCRDCLRKVSRQWRSAPGVHERNLLQERERTSGHRRYWKRYRMTAVEAQALWDKQGGACATCGRTPNLINPKRLVLDHNHTTDQVRGFLCDRCNQALHAIENPALLAALLAYLEQHKKEE
jgi:hypothetical protein